MIHETPLRDRMQGRWAAVLPLLGLERRYLTRRNLPCPWCGGKDRFRWIDKDGSGNWVCNQCGRGDGIMLAERLVGGGFKAAADRIEKVLGEAGDVCKSDRRDKARCRAQMQQLWRRAAPIWHDTPAGLYLASRGIRFANGGLSDALRYCGDCQLFDLRLPALLARVLSPDGKRAVNIQRLFLTPDGEKANVSPPRRMMPGDVPLGSYVRLGEPGKRLGVAESVETALSAAELHGIVVWATCGAANMEAFTAPEGVEELVVFGDRDENYAGQAAAYRLANRAAVQQKLKVSVEIPDMVGDWNDVARSR